MRLKVLSAAASLLAVLPGSSQALGLGDIQLKSSLNAPLEAEIEQEVEHLARERHVSW